MSAYPAPVRARKLTPAGPSAVACQPNVAAGADGLMVVPAPEARRRTGLASIAPDAGLVDLRAFVGAATAVTVRTVTIIERGVLPAR